MRILYHHRTRAGDAQGIHIQEMVRAFEGLGHAVDVVSLVAPADGKERAAGRARWVSALKGLSPLWDELLMLAYNVYGYRLLAAQIRRRRPDLIYERYSLYTCCGVWASRRFGIPLVLEVNAPLFHEESRLGRIRLRPLARAAERWICSNATWTLVVSGVMRDILVRDGVPSERLVVMPNGIDPGTFSPEVSGEAVRQRYGLDGKTVIGFVGWFRPWHGLDTLLEVVREARLGERNVAVLLVGDGPAYGELHRYAARHDLLSTVVFTGPVARRDIPAHVAAMDITVQPSAPEYACPMKILEYLGMGKCVVAPDQRNIRELVEHGVTGFLFRPADEESLKTTLLGLVDSPATRQAAGARARRRIVEGGFFWRSNAERTLGLVLGKGMNTWPLQR